MEALAIFIVITIIAFAGGLYFMVQERKEAKSNWLFFKKKYYFCILKLRCLNTK